MAWTNEQQQAITLRNSSLIVSAAAGSGKTSVLVERLIQILSDPTEKVFDCGDVHERCSCGDETAVADRI